MPPGSRQNQEHTQDSEIARDRWICRGLHSAFLEANVIEQLSGFSAGVVGVKVSGKLRHDDVSKALQWSDEVVAKRGECRMLIVFGDFHGWDAQSFWDHLKFHRYHCDHVRQIAYVGDKWWQQTMVNLCARFRKSEIQYFDISETRAATAWLGEG